MIGGQLTDEETLVQQGVPVLQMPTMH